jgi:Mn-dependent DtxR family transcriptional regulator
MEDVDILKTTKEDILRLLAEIGNKSSLESVNSEIKVSSSLISEAVKELEKENLIQVRQNSITLTKTGQEIANGILENHLIIEQYLKKSRSKEEAHQAAHILEHNISQEVIDNIKKLSALEAKGVPLSEFKFNKEGIISDITIPEPALFERLVSMGIVPGEKIKITNRIGHTLIVSVDKTFALGRDIVREIEVLAE